MKFTGTNILYTPRVPQINYLFEDIFVDSTGLYTVSSVQFIPETSFADSTGFLFKLREGKILDPSGRFISTYNTGEFFSISGWLDFATKYRYLSISDTLNRTIDLSSPTGLLGSISVACPTSGLMSCNIKLFSRRINDVVTFSDFKIKDKVTGYLSSDACMYVNGGNIQFYQSYESLLTGGSLLAFIDTRFPTSIIYSDNDSSELNNSLTFDYQYSTTYTTVINAFTLNRTGLYDSGIAQLSDLNTDKVFSGLFDGEWSGNSFIYRDNANTLISNYYISLSDSAGNPYRSSVNYSVSIPSFGSSLTAEYVTGFQLTSSGEYMNPPQISVTGYYYSVGIAQSLQSLLFSTGCTGNLDVGFVGGGGSGASGLLLLTPVTFSDVYYNGAKQYNIVYDYYTVLTGTGYTSPPKAFVNTGKYGAKCFDVPRSSGYNQAWFSPFDTSGVLSVQAGWFYGVPLCVSGIVGVGETGYYVTGIDVYNIGVGYGISLPPYLSFVRTGVDTLTKNASGILYINTGSVNDASEWKVSIGVAGSSLTGTGLNGTLDLGESNSLTIQLSCSGIDITIPITGSIVVSSLSTLSSSVTGTFIYSKYFDTGQDFLKKKNSLLESFTPNNNLSFTLTQNELDTLYSSAGYSNNTWPFEVGDFDF